MVHSFSERYNPDAERLIRCRKAAHEEYLDTCGRGHNEYERAFDDAIRVRTEQMLTSCECSDAAEIHKETMRVYTATIQRIKDHWNSCIRDAKQALADTLAAFEKDYERPVRRY